MFVQLGHFYLSICFTFLYKIVALSSLVSCCLFLMEYVNPRSLHCFSKYCDISFSSNISCGKICRSSHCNCLQWNVHGHAVCPYAPPTSPHIFYSKRIYVQGFPSAYNMTISATNCILQSISPFSLLTISVCLLSCYF